MSTMPSAECHTVHIGKLYRPTRFEVRTPTSYSARLPELGQDSARLQRALLHAPLDALPLSAEAEHAFFDRLLAWAAVVLAVVTLFALQLHWI